MPPPLSVCLKITATFSGLQKIERRGQLLTAAIYFFSGPRFRGVAGGAAGVDVLPSGPFQPTPPPLAPTLMCQMLSVATTGPLLTEILVPTRPPRPPPHCPTASICLTREGGGKGSFDHCHLPTGTPSSLTLPVYFRFSVSVVYFPPLFRPFSTHSPLLKHEPHVRHVPGRHTTPSNHSAAGVQQPPPPHRRVWVLWIPDSNLTF